MMNRSFPVLEEISKDNQSEFFVEMRRNSVNNKDMNPMMNNFKQFFAYEGILADKHWASSWSARMQGAVWLIWQTRIPKTALFKGIKQNLWQFDNDPPPLEGQKRALCGSWQYILTCNIKVELVAWACVNEWSLLYSFRTLGNCLTLCPVFYTSFEALKLTFLDVFLNVLSD